MNSTKKKRRNIYSLSIFLIMVLAIVILYIIKEEKITGKVVVQIGKVETDPSVVLKLTFDDQNEPWKDYSMYNNAFSSNGNAKWVDKNACKWYGCADFTGYNSDYLNSTVKFRLDNGMSVCFWAYIKEQDSSKSQYYYQIGEDSNLKTQEENSWGMWTKWNANQGSIDLNPQDSSVTMRSIWTHYCASYNPSKGFLLWRNAEVIRNSTATYGSLNYAAGEIIKIGAGRYSDIDGYLDEFIVYNKSIGQSEVSLLYDSTRLGTPPTLDLYVKDIRYTLPIDWSSPAKSLILQNMPIMITVANAGTQSSGKFDYSLELDGQTVCSGKLNLDGLSESNATCNWQSSYGFHKGYFIIDAANSITEDDENNNKQRVYIPFLDRPWFHFSLSEWNKDYKPYCQDSRNAVAYSSCSWMSFFTAEPFQESWSGEDVDPRGKKERENAMGCIYNSYAGDQCKLAVEHALGWGNRNILTYGNVQAIHELAHVGISLDILFPYLDQAAFNTIAKQYHDICQQITNLPNTRPDLDDKSIIQGDNGKGFGSGMATFCYSILGLYSENPTLIQKLDQQYWGSNIVDDWMSREASYLQSFKNDSWSKYQEGLLYKTYSQPHLVENLWFEKRYGLNNIDNYQNALCSMARESIAELLDNTYDGNILRNDEKGKIRWVQRGDSNSYQHVTDGNFADWDILLYYGLLCDDKNTKSALLWLRDKVFEIGEGKNTYPSSYLYKRLKDQIASPENPSLLFPKVIFDNANDILTIRTNYSYVNDNVIQIDGGEEKGGGHSQAQGYYLYALGEPSLDYEQVPYNDDVRAETWKNGISLQNDAQTAEGQSSFYSQDCGKAPLNQYYGMGDCPSPKYPDDYPNHRYFPLEYGGDLEDYVGTEDAGFAGVYVWRPYKNSDPVKEYFVKFGDLLAKRTIVSSNKEGKGVYHNFINIYNEFTEARNGNNLTFTRNSKNLDINLIYSNQTFTLGGGLSGLNICFAKTDCSGINRGSSKYRRTYLYTTSNDVDFILAHHWYTTGSKKSVTALASDADKGLQQGNNIIIFDTNNDGISSYADKKATGWAIVYNDNTKEIGAFNTNSINDKNIELLSSDSLISAHISRTSDKIILTVNTMERNKYIDEPKKVRVTIDAKELSKNSKFAVTKNDAENIQVVSESGTKITFDIQAEQNSDYYVITGGGVGTKPADVAPPAVTFLGNDSTTNQSSFIKAQTDENANLTVFWGYFAGSLFINFTANKTFQTTSTVLLKNLKPNSTIFYIAKSCDPSGNCAASKISSFKTMEKGIKAPNSLPIITSFQPSNLNPQYNFTTTVIFNISGYDADYDLLTLKWFVNKTLNATNKNLSYSFNKIGIFNITAVLSDSFANTSKQWIVKVINDTQQAFPPTILKINFSSPTLKTNIHWSTSELSDSKLEYGTISSLGTSIADSKQTNSHIMALKDLLPGAKYYFKVTSCNPVGCASSSILDFTTIAIKTIKYDGSTTNFNNIDGDNLTNVTLEKKQFGKIRFMGNINITRTIDIDAYTNITSDSIAVDTTNLPELNAPATVTFYNLNFTNPRILKDGSPCSESICKIINYSNSTIIFNVTGFSKYTVEETPQDTGGSGGGSSSAGSDSAGGGSGGGSGGSSDLGSELTFVCDYDWQCAEWSFCENSLQTRICEFAKVAQHSQSTECPAIENAPAKSQTCEAAISETEQPAINEIQPQQSLLDVTLKIQNKKVKVGSDLKAGITIQNLAQNNIDVAATYILKNSKAASVHQETETLSIEKELSFTKTFKLPDLELGDYIAAINVKYENSFAASSDTFTVIKKSDSKIKNYIAILLFGFIIIIFSILPILYIARAFGSRTQFSLKELAKHEIELYKYVIKALEHGISKEKITQILLKVGWKKETINKIIKVAKKK